LPSKPDISLTRFIESVAPTTPSISISDAIPRAEAALNGKYNNHPPTLEYFAKADGTAVLTHVIQVENDTLGTWFEAFVDAHSGDLVSVTDFVAKASVCRFLVLYLWQFLSWNWECFRRTMSNLPLTVPRVADGERDPP